MESSGQNALEMGRYERWCAACLLAWVGWLNGALAASATDQPAWELIAHYSAGSALPVFETKPSPDTLRNTLGLAVSYLGKYPQTTGNVDRAEELLLMITAAPAESEYKAAALYLLGRIAQVFRTGREEQAAEYYQRLRTEFPDSILADSAAVKLALLELQRVQGYPDHRTLRVVIDQLAVPRRVTLLSQFHQSVANFLLEAGDLEQAFAHLQACRDLDVAVGKNRADIQIQVGRVGTQLNRREIAVSAYQDFVRTFPNDSRSYMVSEEIKRLQGRSP
jgi:tetratricopeptide (TPR) repeat protein